MNKKVCIWASVFVAVLFLLATVPVNADISLNRDYYKVTNGNVTNNVIISGQLPSFMQIGFSDPQQGNDEGPEWGAKLSFLTITSLRFLDENLRLRLFGTFLVECKWFDGGDHYSTKIFNVEAWVEIDGVPMYEIANFVWTSHWWGAPDIKPDIDGFYVIFPDHQHVVVNKIHVYVQRTVDDYSPEIHDKVFYKYILNNQVVAEQLTVAGVQIQLDLLGESTTFVIKEQSLMR
jgi:hypothetical protein